VLVRLLLDGSSTPDVAQAATSGKNMSKNHTTWYDLKNSKKWDFVHTKNDLITPCGVNKKQSLQNHTICVWFTPTKL